MCLLALAFITISGCANASDKTARLCLHVPPAAADGDNVPVSTIIQLPGQFDNVPVDELSVSLRQRVGKDAALDGQIITTDDGKKQLWWIMPKAKSGQSTDWIATLSCSKKKHKGAFVWKDKPSDYLDLLIDGRKVIRYMYAYDKSTPERLAATNKPFYHVFDASGENLITNGSDPNILYPHHRGLFFGWQKVLFEGEKYNFWEMRNNTAQVHQKFLQQTAGPVLAKSKSLIKWNDKDGKTLLIEERQITAFRQPSPTIALLEFESLLKPAAGDIYLDALDPNKAADHGGLQFRAHSDISKGSEKQPGGKKSDNKNKAVYLFPKEDLNSVKAQELPWAAMSYTLNSRQYTVQHMNPPGNPSPTLYTAYRDYGRFGAFFREKIPAGGQLAVKYYIWVTEGKIPDRKELAGKYTELTALPAIEPAACE